MNDLKKLQEFAKWVIENSAFAGCSIDGSDVQEEATALGLLVKTRYDPEIHGSHDYAVKGDDWYVYND